MRHLNYAFNHCLLSQRLLIYCHLNHNSENHSQVNHREVSHREVSLNTVCPRLENRRRIFQMRVGSTLRITCFSGP